MPERVTCPGRPEGRISARFVWSKLGAGSCPACHRMRDEGVRPAPGRTPPVSYFLPPLGLGARWDSADAAAVFAAADVRPSRSTLDAPDAAFALVLRVLAIRGHLLPVSSIRPFCRVFLSVRLHRLVTWTTVVDAPTPVDWLVFNTKTAPVFTGGERRRKEARWLAFPSRSLL